MLEHLPLLLLLLPLPLPLSLLLLLDPLLLPPLVVLVLLEVQVFPQVGQVIPPLPGFSSLLLRQKRLGGRLDGLAGPLVDDRRYRGWSRCRRRLLLLRRRRRGDGQSGGGGGGGLRLIGILIGQDPPRRGIAVAAASGRVADRNGSWAVHTEWGR